MIILFVDDEARMMDSYVQYLRAHMSAFNYEVVFLSDIDTAVDVFERRTEEIALVILDIMMPPGKFTNEQTNGGLRTGLAFYETIRQRALDLPIIVFTNVFDHEIEFKPDSKSRFLQKVNYPLDDFVIEVKKALSLPAN